MPAMTVLHRLALLLSLMFWQGGFMFYGAIVVPVGSAVLGSHLTQGIITRQVTNYLYGAGAVCLLFWYGDVAAERRAAGTRLRLALLILLTLALAVQAWLHHHLDELMDPASSNILDQARFHSIHQWYLIVSTLQWAGTMVQTTLTLRAWQKNDAGRG